MLPPKKKHIFGTSCTNWRFYCALSLLSAFPCVHAQENSEFSINSTLKAAYTFSEGVGEITSDSSSNAVESSLVNAPVWNSDNANTALNFDSSAPNYINLGTTPSIPGKSDFAISLWVKTDTAARQTLIQQRSKTIKDENGNVITHGFSGELQIAVTPTGQVTYWLYRRGYQFILTSEATVADGQWHHVAAVRSSNKASLYIDGKLAGESNSPSRYLDVNIPMAVGSDVRSNNNHMNGSLDTILVYHRALSSQAIAQLAADRATVIREDPDFDLDGISNKEELAAGFNPLSAHSDSDGLTDGYEFYTSKTSPISIDTDRDGISDSKEIELGLNPNEHNGNLDEGTELKLIGNVNEHVAAYDDSLGKYVLKVKAGDIWHISDHFAFAAQPFSGDLRLTVKVDSFSNTSAWSKAGLMIRESYNTNSKHAMMIVSGDRGTAFQYRKSTGGSSSHQGTFGKAPYWLTIIRMGNKFTGYVSEDFANGEKHWVKVGETTIDMAADVKVGLALTSNNRSKLSEAVFSNLEIQSLNDADSDSIASWVEDNVSNTDAMHSDTDNDKLNDEAEIAAGTAPAIGPTEIDSKTYHKAGLISRYFNGYFNKLPKAEKLPLYAYDVAKELYFPSTAGKVVGGPLTNGAASFSGKIYIKDAGEYTFYTISDDGTALHIDNTAVINDNTAHGMKEFSGKVTLTAGFHDISVDYFDQGGHGGLKLLWEGPRIKKQVIPSSVLIHAETDFTALNDKVDRDGDLLTDVREAQLGTDPLKADSEKDGLSDYEEIEIYGTNPMEPDSDFDGVADVIETKELGSDANVADFNKTSTVAVSIPGSQGKGITGEWTADENSGDIYCSNRRGEVAFNAEVPENGIYYINIDVNDRFDLSYETKVDFYVDGKFVGFKTIDIKGYTPATIKIFTPWIAAGSHEIKMLWENARIGRHLNIKKLDLITLGGTDNNANGTKDWMENAVAKRNTLASVTSSKVSPAIVRGTARFPELIAVKGPASVKTLANSEIIQSVTLTAGSAVTVETSFENKAKNVSNTISWTPTDILTEKETTLIQGQSLLLTAGDVSADSPATIDGSSVTEPTVKAFNEAGTFTIQAVNGEQTDSITVNVLPKYELLKEDGSEQYFAMREGHQRVINLSEMNIPKGAVIEADSRLKKFEQTETQLKITIDENKSRFLTVKDKESGTIIGRIHLEGFQFFGIEETGMTVKNTNEDGSVVLTMPLISSPALDDVSYKMNIFLSGVVFTDGTTSMVFNKDSFDEIGSTVVELIKTSAARKTAGCHHIEMYQGNNNIGRIY